DGGAALWAETIRQVRAALPTTCLEALVPDFGGSLSALQLVLASAPDILAHNLETVADLYPRARSGADYARSLHVLRAAHSAGVVTKTGIMLGLGETREQVLALMRDAVATGCEILTIGQYLQPSKAHLPVQRYLEPAEFEEYRKLGLEIGFRVVISGPLVRSSFFSRDQEAYLKQRMSIRSESS
ncbi:MAG: lipoyl synthase, partial [Kiritimatiellae bacterium]|nr:lipoyl synthase [Kiritimatiellia bacterium]